MSAVDSSSWLDNIGQRTLRSPAGFWSRVRFGRAALAATFRVPAAERASVRAASAGQVWRSGVRQLPVVGGVGLALGVLVIGQAVSLLQEVSAQKYMGTVMVMVILRELGPLLTAFLVAARPGTAVVVELGALQFTGSGAPEENAGALSLRHLIAPRVIGLALAGFCLTIYLIAVALVSGYFMAFLHGVPLRGSDYAGQLADALHWLDFVLIALKATLFGVVIAVVSCYHGLERMLRIEELPAATTRAVLEGLGTCLLIDAIFLLGYLIR